MRWIIRAAAYRAKWIDQSQSLNIFFRGSSGKELSEVYFYAWRMGLKTTYYLRTLAATQVEKSTVSTAEFGSTHRRDTEAPAGSMTAFETPAPLITPSPVQAAMVEELSGVGAAIAPNAFVNRVPRTYTLHKAPEALCESCE